jgi:hypothetical protein
VRGLHQDFYQGRMPKNVLTHFSLSHLRQFLWFPWVFRILIFLNNLIFVINIWCIISPLNIIFLPKKPRGGHAWPAYLCLISLVGWVLTQFVKWLWGSLIFFIGNLVLVSLIFSVAFSQWQKLLSQHHLSIVPVHISAEWVENINKPFIYIQGSSNHFPSGGEYRWVEETVQTLCLSKTFLACKY